MASRYGYPWLLLVPQIHPCSPCIPSLVLLQAMVGGFKDTPIDDLVVAVLKETLKRTGVKPEVGGVHCSSKGGQIWSAHAAVVGRGRRQIGSMHATQEAGAIDGNKKSTEDSLWWEIVAQSDLQEVGDVVFGSGLGPSSKRANEASWDAQR